MVKNKKGGSGHKKMAHKNVAQKGVTIKNYERLLKKEKCMLV